MLSQQSLVAQGFSASFVDQVTGPTSQAVTFNTGGGPQHCSRSLGLTSNLLGKTEAYVLDASPTAFSMGQIVNEQCHPLVWEPGKLPYHVTDPEHLKVICSEKYRMYATRVENNVPTWEESIQVGTYPGAEAAPN